MKNSNLIKREKLDIDIILLIYYKVILYNISVIKK